MPTRVPLAYGCASFGAENSTIAAIHDLSYVQKVLDVFVDKYQGKILDTAAIYSAGTSEEFLSKLNVHGARVDTKIWPMTPGDFAPEIVRQKVLESVARLAPHKVRTMYLHRPDRTVPVEDTLREINELYKEGHFEEFGLSNYNSWEVAEIVTICKIKGYVLPVVYQGVYNAVRRGAEAELFPALRKFNIRFEAYSPLAGGFLSGNVKSATEIVDGSRRFDLSTFMGTMYSKHYLHGKSFEAIGDIATIAAKYNLTLNEIALRWLQHHSALTPADCVIIGASKVEQLEQSCPDSEKGALPEEVVKVLDESWAKVMPTAAHYAM